jgi:hypothetical protein
VTLIIKVFKPLLTITENLYLIMEVIIMTGKNIFRFIFALAIIAGLALGGIALYQMGFSHGTMTNFTLPEGSEIQVMPYAHYPMGWHAGPRVGLLGLLPLLCFGGFFFLVFMCGFGFMARKRAWMHHYGPGWKHHGPPPWGQGRPPWAEGQPEAGTEAPPAETDNPQE